MAYPALFTKENWQKLMTISFLSTKNGIKQYKSISNKFYNVFI
jgi:hypothetical protein